MRVENSRMMTDDVHVGTIREGPYHYFAPRSTPASIDMQLDNTTYTVASHE